MLMQQKGAQTSLKYMRPRGRIKISMKVFVDSQSIVQKKRRPRPSFISSARMTLHLAAQHTQQALRRCAVITHTLLIQHCNLRLITLLN
jgi:hypothetical protein